MSDIAIMIDELIERVTDNFRLLVKINKDFAEGIIAKEYPDGDAPFTAEDFLNEWEALREEKEQERKARKREADLQERATLIRAMETIARCTNDECVFEHWLMVGVPDGFIDDEVTDEEIADEYEDDELFKELLDAFLDLMAKARESGGLYGGGVVSNRG